MTTARTRSIDDAFSVAVGMRALLLDVDLPRVGAKYELLRKIGAGAFGTVYEAHDHDLGRRVAVKVLDLGDVDVAKREGQLLAEFEYHPNVLQIYDHGFGDDYRYFVLQLLVGPTLAEWCLGKTPAEIVEKFAEAARGLAAAHAKGLIHRDFKPGNVRIGAHGQAVVVDFGLARHLDTLETDTASWGYIGTLPYTAPERLIGLAGDERADQFSFCVALWECLSGVNPFGSCEELTTPTERYQAIQRGPQETPRAARRVVRALLRGLSVRPADRFSTMDRLIEAVSPKPRRWAAGAFMMFGAMALLIAGVLAQSIPAGGNSKFVAGALASWSGPRAVMLARGGDMAGALNEIELAARRGGGRGEHASRMLCDASITLALELEERQLYHDAFWAWAQAIRFARDAGDTSLVGQIQERATATIETATGVPPRRSK